jgi:hypothetical protein
LSSNSGSKSGDEIIEEVTHFIGLCAKQDRESEKEQRKSEHENGF